MRAVQRLALGAALSVGLAGASLAQDITADTVLATVGDAEITLGHLIAAGSTLPAEYQTLPDDVIYDGLLDQLIQQNALAQSMEGKLSKFGQLALDNQRSGMMASEAMAMAGAEATTEDALRAAYEEKYAGQSSGMEFNASHILVETEEEAKTVIAELEGGADFAEVAREKSTGPSGPNGGSLGWFQKGVMVPEFEQAVTTLSPGDLSEPVQTQFGWHVIMLNETRLKEAPSFEEARGDLVESVREEAVRVAIEQVTKELPVSRVILEVDKALVRNMDLLSE